MAVCRFCKVSAGAGAFVPWWVLCFAAVCSAAAAASVPASLLCRTGLAAGSDVTPLSSFFCRTRKLSSDTTRGLHAQRHNKSLCWDTGHDLASMYYSIRSTPLKVKPALQRQEGRTTKLKETLENHETQVIYFYILGFIFLQSGDDVYCLVNNTEPKIFNNTFG